ncbi:MAG: hypothetical protein AB1500_03790 [Bacillota bacterium]
MKAENIIVFPEVLRTKLGDEAAKQLVDIVNATAEKTKNDVFEFLIERFESRLAKSESSLIRWMFLFWVGQLAVTTGIVFTFLGSIIRALT